jgi:hypothetical protein
MAEQREAVQFFVDGGLSVQRACVVVQERGMRSCTHP